MALHAAAVEILIEKARFEPEVALGIAEAIDVSIMHAQLVTVPILDARLQELRAEMRLLIMGLETRLTGLENSFEAKLTSLENRLETSFETRLMGLEAKSDGKLQELRSELKSDIARLEVKIEAVKAELVRWVFLAMLGNVALSAGVAALLRYLG